MPRRSWYERSKYFISATFCDASQYCVFPSVPSLWLMHVSMQGKRQVQEITESLTTHDIVDVSDSLIERLCFCWDACSPGEGTEARGEASAMSLCVLHILECISKLLVQLPCSNTGAFSYTFRRSLLC